MTCPDPHWIIGAVLFFIFLGPPVARLVQGCHENFDQGALFTKAVRRELEPVWAADTQRRILAMGLWPQSWASGPLPRID
jgi:hypothetical protein